MFDPEGLVKADADLRPLFAPYLEAFRDLPAALRERAVPYMTVGSLNKDARGTMTDGESLQVMAGMAMALVSRGWEYGRNLLHLCFPMAGHNETGWGTRLHLPLQFLNGAVARAYRVKRPVLGDHPFEHGQASPERP